MRKNFLYGETVKITNGFYGGQMGKVDSVKYEPPYRGYGSDIPSDYYHEIELQNGRLTPFISEGNLERSNTDK